MTTLVDIAHQLQRRGVRVTRIEQGDESVDDSLVITPLVHVQVGYGYMCVVKELPDDCFRFYEERDSFDGLVADIRDAMGQEAIK